MTALWIILGVLLGLLLLFALLLFFGKAGIRIRYDGKIRVTVYVLSIPLTLVGKEKKQRAPKSLARCKHPERVLKKELKKQKKAAKKAYQKAQKKKKARHALQKQLKKADQPSLGIPDHLGIILEILKVLREQTRGKVRVRVRKLKIRVATEDAAKTAILYGVILQSASYLLEWINRRFCPVTRKKDELQIVPDYLSTSSSASLDIYCSMSMIQIAMLALRLLNTHKEETEKAVLRAKKKAQKEKKELLERS